MNEAIRHLSQSYRERLSELPIFDANVWLGQPEGFPLAQEINVDELKRTLESYGISQALVSHWRGKTLSAQDGNTELQRLSDRLGESLYTIWTGLPLFPSEDGPLPGVGDVDRFVRGVRIFPKTHNFEPVSWCVGSLCQWMCERRLPLFIWHTETDFRAIFELAGAFPKLRIVVESQPRKILYPIRTVLSLMQERPNIMLETSNLVGAGYVEYFVKETGPERLLFGSFCPMNDPFVAAGMILDADITDEQKKLLAGDNLRRLVEEVLS